MNNVYESEKISQTFHFYSKKNNTKKSLTNSILLWFRYMLYVKQKTVTIVKIGTYNITCLVKSMLYKKKRET